MLDRILTTAAIAYLMCLLLTSVGVTRAVICNFRLHRRREQTLPIRYLAALSVYAIVMALVGPLILAMAYCAADDEKEHTPPFEPQTPDPVPPAPAPTPVTEQPDKYALTVSGHVSVQDLQPYPIYDVSASNLGKIAQIIQDDRYEGMPYRASLQALRSVPMFSYLSSLDRDHNHGPDIYLQDTGPCKTMQECLDIIRGRLVAAYTTQASHDSWMTSEVPLPPPTTPRGITKPTEEI